MDAVMLVGLVTAFVLILTVGGFIADRIGNSANTTPWAPGSPRPGARRRPCLDERCRVDHEAIWSNRKVW